MEAEQAEEARTKEAEQDKAALEKKARDYFDKDGTYERNLQDVPYKVLTPGPQLEKLEIVEANVITTVMDAKLGLEFRQQAASELLYRMKKRLSDTAQHLWIKATEAPRPEPRQEN